MGGGGGGGMPRTVQRAIRAGVGRAAQEPFSYATTTTTTTTSSTATASTNNSSTSATTSRPSHQSNAPNLLSIISSSFSLPMSATLHACSSPTYSDEFEWDCIDGCEDEREFSDDFVFGSVPSKAEVRRAVSAFQQVLDSTSFSQFIKGRLAYISDKVVADEVASPTGLMNNRVYSVGRELDWIEPSLNLCNPGELQHHGSDRVYDAFHLLHTEPSIQRMVVSLSSDKAVWDAVLNNEVVQELRESLIKAGNSVPENQDNSSDGSDAATDILRWIFNNSKAKVMELIEKITKLVNELFQPLEDEKTTRGDSDPFEEKLRTSFMLSIVVLLIVVVSRAHAA